jgi:hypothetical protein
MSKSNLAKLVSNRTFLFGLVTTFLGSFDSYSQEDSEDPDDFKEPARFYRSPEERREAGLGTPLSEWLTFYGLLEAEYEYSKNWFRDGFSAGQYEDTETLQIGLEAEFTEWLLSKLNGIKSGAP